MNQIIAKINVAPSRQKTSLRKRLPISILWPARNNAPGGVGGLRILETLTINELYQCHPPSLALTLGPQSNT